MSAFLHQRVRIAFNLASKSPAMDQIPNSQPIIWKGNDVLFEFAAYYGGALIDISGITSVAVQVKPKPLITGTALFSKTISSGFSASLTEEAWESYTDRHFAAAMTAAESSVFTLDNGLSQDFWLVVRASCVSSQTVFTLGTANLTVMEDGH